MQYLIIKLKVKLVNIDNVKCKEVVSSLRMKSWAEKVLETVNCFVFLKCKLILVIRAC
jgi:hypothetical protein